VERYFKTGFWGVNVGLALMVVLNLFPAGVVQLADVVQNGYAHARSVEFTMTGFFHASEWVRMIGDLTFILVGVVPILIGTLKAVLLINGPTAEAESARARALATTP
jgi:nitric oxide reductase subunit B